MAKCTCGAKYLGEIFDDFFLIIYKFFKSSYGDFIFQKKPWQAEKSKTGHQNKLTCLVALAHCGEWGLLQAELARLKSFSPIQYQLQRLIQQYAVVGKRAFFDMGYLAPS